MKLYKILILVLTSTILTACIPDTFTKWKVEDPTSSEEGAKDPDIPGTLPPDVSIPPVNIAYTPPSYPQGSPEASYFFDQTSQISSGELPEPLVAIALDGGEIKEGDMSFFVSQVKTKDGIITGERSLPQGMDLNPLTGEITGFAQAFTDGKFYTIQGDHIGGTSVSTTIQITISTKPESLYYPQVNGLSLVLNVDKPENFQVGNAITSNRNAQGVVNYVDNEKKTLHIQVASCSLSVASCPIFAKDDLIDDTTGFFREEAKIIEEVTYAYQNTISISTMIPVIIPGIDGQRSEFSISPDIRDWGIDFDRDTGEISGVPETGACSNSALKTVNECVSPATWTSTGVVNLPKTLFTVTVKNINGQTSNVDLYLSSLDVVTPQAINSISYNYLKDYRVVLNVADLRPFQKDSSLTNQTETAGTIIGINEVEEKEEETEEEDVSGSLLVKIKDGSKLKFKIDQNIDDSDPFIVPLTTIKSEPELVFLLNKATNIPVTIEPLLTSDEEKALNWKSDPELPHLCNSIRNEGTVFYPEENFSDCLDNNKICADGSGDTEPTCTGGQWITDGTFNSTQELYFNRKAGTFGAKNPTKAFQPQKFVVTVTSLDGSETKTEITFGFQSSPENLSYSNQAILAVDKYDKFNVNDFISTPKGASGIIKGKVDSHDGEKLLIVKVLAGEFEKNSDIDNLKVFTYQKANINEIKYGQLGIAISGPVTDFAVGEEISDTTNRVTGIVQYRQSIPIPILWVRMIKLDEGSNINETFITTDTIKTASVIGVFGDVLNVRHLGSTNFAAGMDVAASPTAGFGMVNSAESAPPSVILSQASGNFSLGSDLYRMNPSNTSVVGQESSAIEEVGQVQTFYIDRGNQLSIQPVLDSPEDNGITFSITPSLPTGLTLDESTGKISITEGSKGPVASNLLYYTIVAKNLLGDTSTKFGLKVREVFSIQDITGLGDDTDAEGGAMEPNLTSVLHKSGEGHNNAPCRITEDQIYATDSDASPAGWASRAKNITCIYDVGEADLFYNGLKLKLNVGPDLCQYIEHVPTWFYAYQLQETDPDATDPVVQHIGEWANARCAAFQPGGSRAEYPDGLPQESCIGDYSDSEGPNCDEGSVAIQERNYTVIDACIDTSSGATPDITEEECITVNGFCSDPTFSARDDCLSAPGAPSWISTTVFTVDGCFISELEENQTDCEDSYGICSGGTSTGTETRRDECDAVDGVWETSGVFISDASCQSDPGMRAIENFSCEGSKLSCVAGPAKDLDGFPENFITDRFGNNSFGKVTPVSTETEIEFTYASPNSKDYKSNLYLSNYSRLNSCTPYNGNDFEYDIDTWTEIGELNDPKDATDSSFNPFAGGNNVYDYRCLDGARNVRARIRLLIRDWDKDFKPSNRVDVMNLVNPPWLDALLMDNLGDDDFNFPANSFDDWDDRSTGGSCDAPEYNYPEADL